MENKNLSAAAIDQLRKVKDHILEEPKRYYQNDWLLDDALVIVCRVGEKNVPPCNTMGCIAGWVCVLNNKIGYARSEGFLSTAQHLLGLDYASSRRLFRSVSNDHYELREYSKNKSGWPYRFAIRYLKAKTPRGRARAAADRIEHFIATDGEE